MSENKHTPEPFGHELKRLAEKVKGWSSCNAAWSIVDEDDPEYLTAAIGAIGEDGEEYPVAIVDCDNYFAGSDSLHLANFYAAANPQSVLEIIKQRDELLAVLEHIRRCIPIGGFVQIHDGSATVEDMDSAIYSVKGQP